MDKEKTLVVFRRWPEKDGGDVIALFPEIEDRWPYCSSYQHIGQHGGADYRGVVDATKPAKPAEYKSLQSELRSIGYNLKIRSRYIRARSTDHENN